MSRAPVTHDICHCIYNLDVTINAIPCLSGLLKDQIASKITWISWSVTKCPSPAHEPNHPVGGTSRHSKCGQNYQTLITLPSREARTCLLPLGLLIPIFDYPGRMKFALKSSILV
ncbi:hypothetical protein AVEN_128526-1 [Araneus ventricosus]|uniref:Uncharacterized protein n=1 Tax=Araneus ventricosus TaxID=182803 RepID=A0A4Y2K1K7_ARAVE|nr:hypothetical protein AVEN_128526-1 [Araneus ventricosus]